MTDKEDLRVRKTKAALNAAFADLISKKAFEDISVNELCVTAGIRRATFYKHYKDKCDFFSEYVGSLRIRYDSRPGTVSHIEAAVDYYVNYAKRVVEYLSENESTVENALTSSQLHLMIGVITDKNYHDTYEKLNASVRTGMALPASAEVVSAMLIGGVATTVLQWLAAGKNKDASLLTEEIAVLVRNILKVE